MPHRGYLFVARKTEANFATLVATRGDWVITNVVKNRDLLLFYK
jgi:hypothetical protein